MKRTLLMAGCAVLATGCNLFVNPTVACPTGRSITLTQVSSPTRSNLPCTFADPAPFTVAWAPQVDTSLVGSDGKAKYTVADNKLLPGGAVTVTGGSAATLLCTDVTQPCTDHHPQITATIRPDGTLTYQGLFSLDGLGAVLNAGDRFQWEGTLLTETFGPGNSCSMTAKIDLTCQKSQ